MADAGAESNTTGGTDDPVPAPAPPEMSGEAEAAPGGGQEALAAVVPYRNPYALMAYYCGVFSLIPCAGLVLGSAGFVLGIMGLREARRHREAKGKVHAWIGIVVGGLFALVNIAAIGIIVVDASRVSIG